MADMTAERAEKLTFFYQKHPPSKPKSAAAIRKMVQKEEWRVLCGKLEDKYGEDPEEVWRQEHVAAVPERGAPPALPPREPEAEPARGVPQLRAFFDSVQEKRRITKKQLTAASRGPHAALAKEALERYDQLSALDPDAKGFGFDALVEGLADTEVRPTANPPLLSESRRYCR